MRKRTVNPAQPGLFDDPASFPLPAASASRLDPPPAAERFSLVDQIARDEQTLRLGSDWWIPSREFFEERIASYRAYLLTL